MGKSTNILTGKKYDFVNKKANYYDFAELNYYEPDAFNQPENSSDVDHI